MKIAIIGCGFAGLSSAIFLSQKSHEVSIFDKFSIPTSVGAGILLQPSAQIVLEHLDIYSEILKYSEKIHLIRGINQNKKEVFLTQYKYYNEQVFGLGLQRQTLFDVLYKKCLTLNIKFNFNHEIKEISELNSFDFIIIANGTHSNLRKELPIEQSYKPYPYGCLWNKTLSSYSPNQLSQFLHSSKEMFGVLPSGINSNNERVVSLFWSIKNNTKYDMQYIFEKMAFFLGDNEKTFSEHISRQSFNFAHYADVWMKKYNYKNFVVIGDAAHAMSPQLGQGANMALLDSYFLSSLLNENNLEYSLELYSKLRKNHTKFYSQASKFLTPLFQSDSNLNGILRDYIFYISKQIPFSNKINSQILCGKRTSWFYNKEIKY